MHRLTFAFVVAAAAASALPPLSENERVTTAMRDARVADKIQTECESISARNIALIVAVNSLTRHVKSLGYTSEDIDAYMASKTERKRIYGMADAYMAQNGVEKTSASTYCALGRAEIEAGSQIGSLLRER